MTKKRRKNIQHQGSVDGEFASRVALGKYVADTLTTLIRWAGIVICVYFVYKSIEALAGKETMSKISLTGKLGTDISFSPPFYLSVALALCLAGITYGWFQRKEKQRVIAHFESRKVQWEESIDPGRKSSQLNADGTTRIGDL
ncbi:hypothetical protein [Desulfogranum japonicum]|uniref:hypothetical protein n=1 Tax=Desulfogranum japonicum TaxID=231447 RepID=UPI00040553DF|nr:hypothetical protein [Desulfogranum japonicum]